MNHSISASIILYTTMQAKSIGQQICRKWHCEGLIASIDLCGASISCRQLIVFLSNSC